MYSVIGIPLLFISGFVAKPETNFVIADFWRWMVIHMWVEAFFEVFITVIVSYLMVLMGLVSRQAAIRVVYFATVLFLGTGLLGIWHNFLECKTGSYHGIGKRLFDITICSVNFTDR